MNSSSVLSGDRIDFEKKFVLWLCALLLVGYLAYAVLAARGAHPLAAIVVIALVAAAASWSAHLMFFRPIRQLMVVAEAVGNGDYSQRLSLSRNDEIGALARAMDTMCLQLAAAEAATDLQSAALEQLRHSDRIATLGRLASSVAHELGNPLNAVELRAELIRSGSTLTLEQTREHALAIMEQTRRMTRIIEEILCFARRHPAKMTRVDIEHVVRKAVSLSQHTAKRKRSRMTVEMPVEPIHVNGDADRLLQVFVNLLVNGAQSMDGGGALRVKLWVEEPRRRPECVSPGPYVCVEFVDTGHGIASDNLHRVFEPFFSTKTDSGGTGLGLSVAQGIVREHGGVITVDSCEGCGSTFKVYLPVCRDGGTGAHAA